MYDINMTQSLKKVFRQFVKKYERFEGKKHVISFNLKISILFLSLTIHKVYMAILSDGEKI